MNNSELSEATSSADAFTEPRTYGYQESWDNSHEDLLQGNIALHNGRSTDGTTGIKCLDKTSVDTPLDYLRPVYGRPRFESERLDRGLWLFCGSSARQSQWDYLRAKGQNVAKLRNFSLRYFSALKRVCDFVGSAVFLIALFPLFILVATLIKLDSSGPVFFRHCRVGKNGKGFVLWKFRSMRMGVAKYATSPQNAEDVRLTRVGRLIRRLSIDELPQLINVLKGEMSLVGPRPEMPFIVESYRSAEHERLAVTPGITGLWQISPARAFPIHENLQYDLHYIRNQNFVLDCAIILRTIVAVIHGVGAV
jgi:lipopolysaccharide/colanic/teichoic acid biosynthesis glycosyltransferase